MAIKKVYVELVNLLESNADKKVSTILDAVKALCEGKATGGITFLKDAEGLVIAVKCYYGKTWMPLVGSKAVDFGLKASTAHGFNTMCKAGVNAWTQQNSASKKANAALLEDVKAGTVEPSAIEGLQAEIAAERAAIKPEIAALGFSTVADLVDYLSTEHNVEFDATAIASAT